MSELLCLAYKKSLKYQNTMYMNSKLIYTVQKQTLLFPGKLDWYFYGWTGNLQLCTWIFWDTLSFACDYCVHILHLHTAIEFAVSQSDFICRNVINGSILWQRANWLQVNTWGRIPYPLQVYKIIHLQKRVNPGVQKVTTFAISKNDFPSTETSMEAFKGKQWTCPLCTPETGYR